MENRKDTTHGGVTAVQVIQGEAELLNETSTDTQARVQETLEVKSFVKSLPEEDKKLVSYLGNLLWVHTQVTHIAADKDGGVYGYYSKPERANTGFLPTQEAGFLSRLATVEFYNEDDWKDSLREV